MCCCYRDTKMEIQGLADAQNTHYQHGVPRRTGLSPPRSTKGPSSSKISNENEVAALSDTHKTHSDNNNNRPRTSSFRLLAENGSGVCLSELSKPHGKNIHTQLLPQSHAENSGNNNITAVKDTDFRGLHTASAYVKGVSKYCIEKEDRSLQMALPLFDGEDGYSEHSQQCQQLTLNKNLRQQHLDGATLQQSLVSENTVTPRSNNTDAAKAKTEYFYVDFNVVQEGDVDTVQKDQPISCLTKDGERINGKAAVSSEIKTFSSMEVHSTPLLLEPDDELNNVISRTLNSQPASLSDVSFINASERLSDSTVTDGTRRGPCLEAENGNIVLSNEYGETVRHAHLSREIISENDLASTELPPSQLSSPSETKIPSAMITTNEDMMDSVEMPDGSNNSEYMSDFTGLSETPSSVDTRASSGIAPATSHETFSGTIMINNQSIIVTIENGVLTLAAPPEGYTYKDDGMVSLKEHLGMKDHEDIVLLNYDSGTKSIGKISNVAVSAQQDEPKAGLSVSDTELNLADDCSLSEIGVTLDSCTSIKQEDVQFCGMDEGDPPAERPPKSTSTATGEDELQPMSMAGVTGLSKKAALVTYCCSEPGCTSSFDTRQKLKLHLVNHTEDQRPFKCTVEGCGWSFTTSYKLKRHLQSHDKLRPYRCEWENCGRRFTTVYNLKAHAKAHDRENAFACEVCSERFRSATRLANHQRTHFEPERPFKCEFPGECYPRCLGVHDP